MKRNSQVDSKFFTRWSPDMAYVLGVICTDGCLVEHENGHHTLNITSKDLAWLYRIKTALQAAHTVGAKQRAYQLQIRNRDLYQSLLDLGLTPRKSKTLRLPTMPPMVFRDFVRGCFDGDGCVRVWQEKRWRHSWQLRTTFASGSREFLEALRSHLCEQAQLTRGSMWLGTRAYYLQYTIRDSLRLYGFMYHQGIASLYLLRKRQRFEEFLDRKRDPNPLDN